MSEMPVTPAAAPPAPAPKRRFPMWVLGVVALVLICACVGCIVVLGPAMGPAISAFSLPAECQERNPDLDAATCGQWMQTVQAELSACISEAISNGTDTSTDALYECLEAKGAGPQ